MNSGRYILSQVLELVHRQTLDRLVQRYDAESKVRHFGCRQQLICMAFTLTAHKGMLAQSRLACGSWLARPLLCIRYGFP